MSKKAKVIVTVSVVAGVILTVISALVIALFVREWYFSRPFVPAEDEIALYFTLNTEEDVGLIVFDYTANGRDFSGGVSNANRTPLKKGEVIIDTRSREELECEGTTVRLTFELRIITEYVDPNYENIYPEEITRRLQPVSWTAAFGTAYDVVITGSKTKGYTVAVSEHAGEA